MAGLDLLQWASIKYAINVIKKYRKIILEKWSTFFMYLLGTYIYELKDFFTGEKYSINQ